MDRAWPSCPARSRWLGGWHCLVVATGQMVMLWATVAWWHKPAGDCADQDHGGVLDPAPSHPPLASLSWLRHPGASRWMAPLPALRLFQTETLHSAWALPGKDAPDCLASSREDVSLLGLSSGWRCPRLLGLSYKDTPDCLGCLTKTLLTAWAHPDRGISLLGLSSRQRCSRLLGRSSKDAPDCLGSSRPRCAALLRLFQTEMCRTASALPKIARTAWTLPKIPWTAWTLPKMSWTVWALPEMSQLLGPSDKRYLDCLGSCRQRCPGLGGALEDPRCLGLLGLFQRCPSLLGSGVQI